MLRGQTGTIILDVKLCRIPLTLRIEADAACMLVAETPGISQQVPDDLAQVVGVELKMQGIGHVDYDGVCRDFFSLPEFVDQSGEHCGIETDRLEAVAPIERQHFFNQAIEPP